MVPHSCDGSWWGHMNHFFTQFLCQAICTQRTPKRPKYIIVGSINVGYISDTARNRTHNLYCPKREPMPLCHSDGLRRFVCFPSKLSIIFHPSYSFSKLVQFCRFVFKLLVHISLSSPADSINDSLHFYFSCGVPQGSVLGPPFLTLYVGDLEEFSREYQVSPRLGGFVTNIVNMQT